MRISSKTMENMNKNTSSSSWSKGSGWRLVLGLVIVAVATECVLAKADRNPGFTIGEAPKARVCPPAKEISPCSCSVMSKG